ncbi:MAG: SUMF1/EgtB/PvdO family nonheme iron enzyme [Gemmatimonadota bacterium]|nr:SUMF1/EgtB/PvdO family nonheme iron enzyme [Gemmatimonadota bacterium]
MTFDEINVLVNIWYHGQHSHTGDLSLKNPVAHIYKTPAMRCIPEGMFSMGSINGSRNEQPVHDVWLDTFFMARFPTTRTEYRSFLMAGDYPVPAFWEDTRCLGDYKPVVGVSWNDAMAYCRWLGEVTDGAYRLPSEAEWEKAGRGGLSGCEFPWGNDLPVEYQGGRDSRIENVGTQDGPNGYGLYDLAGGVHEWCSDFYASDYYAASPCDCPQGPSEGTRRSARGGSWRHAVRYARCAARSRLAPEKRFSDFGFRCAATHTGQVEGINPTTTGPT